jgi:hypothetical protein
MEHDMEHYMEHDKLSINLEKLKMEESSKKVLDIYYCIDLDKSIQDIDNIARCLETYINVIYKEYKLNIFKSLEYIKIEKNDVVKSGLYTFNRMCRELKLKTLNDTWFIYLSNGNIKTEYKNVFVLLLNRNPREKSSYYVINKNQLNIKREYTNANKLIGLKFLKKTIHELFNTDRFITYTNLIDF